MDGFPLPRSFGFSLLFTILTDPMVVEGGLVRVEPRVLGIGTGMAFGATVI